MSNDGQRVAVTGTVEAASSHPDDDDACARQDGERIDQLLAELQTMAGPQTWACIEELLQRTVSVYGQGLARMLQHARHAGAAETELAAQVTADPLVSSLLLLHGMHPAPLQDRVHGAIAALAPLLAPHGVTLELLAVEATALRLRVRRETAACASTSRKVEESIEHAIHEAAPEVERIAIEDPKAEAGKLVQLSLGPRRQR